MQGMPIVQASSQAWPGVASMWSSGFNSGWILDESIGATGGFIQSVSPASSGQGFYSTGDATPYYVPGRMLKVIDAGGTHYCEVLSSSSSAVAGTTSSTIVTITNVVSGTTTLSTGSLTSVSGSPIFPSSGMLSNFGAFSTGSASLPGMRFRGSLGGIGLSVDGSTFLGFNVLGTEMFSMSTAALLGVTDNAYDIGASGANRPKTGYFGTALVVGTNPPTTGALNVRVDGSQIFFLRLEDSQVGGRAYNIANGSAAAGTFSIYDPTAAVHRFQITSTGAIKIPSIGTTASAANAFLDSGDSNNILRSTSSLRYKTVLSYLGLDAARRVILGLRPIIYRSNAKSDDPNREFVGLAAEHVDALDARFVTRDIKRRPDWVQYPALVAPLALIAQDHERRLQQIDQKLSDIQRVA